MVFFPKASGLMLGWMVVISLLYLATHKIKPFDRYAIIMVSLQVSMTLAWILMMSPLATVAVRATMWFVSPANGYFFQITSFLGWFVTTLVVWIPSQTTYFRIYNPEWVEEREYGIFQSCALISIINAVFYVIHRVLSPDVPFVDLISIWDEITRKITI